MLLIETRWDRFHTSIHTSVLSVASMHNQDFSVQAVTALSKSYRRGLTIDMCVCVSAHLCVCICRSWEEGLVVNAKINQ